MLSVVVSGLASGCVGEGEANEDPDSVEVKEDDVDKVNEWRVMITEKWADGPFTFTGEVTSHITEDSPGELALKLTNKADHKIRIAYFMGSTTDPMQDAWLKHVSKEASLWIRNANAERVNGCWLGSGFILDDSPIYPELEPGDFISGTVNIFSDRDDGRRDSDEIPDPCIIEGDYAGNVEYTLTDPEKQVKDPADNRVYHEVIGELTVHLRLNLQPMSSENNLSF